MKNVNIGKTVEISGIRVLTIILIPLGTIIFLMSLVMLLVHYFLPASVVAYYFYDFSETMSFNPRFYLIIGALLAGIGIILVLVKRAAPIRHRKKYVEKLKKDTI